MERRWREDENVWELTRTGSLASVSAGMLSFSLSARRNGLAAAKNTVKAIKRERRCRSLSPLAISDAIKSDISAGAVYRDSTKNLPTTTGWSK